MKNKSEIKKSMRYAVGSRQKTVHNEEGCCLLPVFYCLLLTGTAIAEEAVPTAQPLPLNARVGVILPLSGRYAAFGEQALKGILLAADTFGTTFELNKGLSLEIIVKDTKDDPLASERAVEELAADKDVMGIIGQLLSVTAIGAARKAQELKLPMITLSQKQGLTGAGDYIFRNFLVPAEQAKAVVDYAV